MHWVDIRTCLFVVYQTLNRLAWLCNQSTTRMKSIRMDNFISQLHILWFWVWSLLQVESSYWNVCSTYPKHLDMCSSGSACVSWSVPPSWHWVFCANCSHLCLVADSEGGHGPVGPSLWFVYDQKCPQHGEVNYSRCSTNVMKSPRFARYGDKMKNCYIEVSIYTPCLDGMRATDYNHMMARQSLVFNTQSEYSTFAMLLLKMWIILAPLRYARYVGGLHQYPYRMHETAATRPGANWFLRTRERAQ